VIDADPVSRLLNLSVMIKELNEDCDTAEKTISYKDYAKDYHKSFDIMKTDMKNEVKRIKEIRLYPGTDENGDKDNYIVGGIDIIYELNSGEEYEDGLIDLESKMVNVDPTVLELKDNERNHIFPYFILL
jgi:hypothetical protein